MYVPSSISHQISTQQENNIIVVLTVEDDNTIPAIASHPKSFASVQANELILSSFISSEEHFPKFFWASLNSYPTISSLPTLDGIIFIDVALFEILH